MYWLAATRKRIDKWMDGWMDGWDGMGWDGMDGWMDGCLIAKWGDRGLWSKDLKADDKN